MKKQAAAIVTGAAVIASSLAACGTSASSASTASGTSSSPSVSSEAAAASSEAGSSSEAASEASGSSSDLLSGTQFEGVTPAENYKFMVIVKAFQSTYWQAAVQGVEKAADELGIQVDTQGPNTESDIADQVNMLNSAIAGDYKGIALAASDTSAVLTSLSSAKDAGIPVVAFDTGIADAPEGSLAASITTDSESAGATAAQHMYEALRDRILSADGQVRIGEVNITATALNIQQRGLGFIKELISEATEDGKTVAVIGNDFYVENSEATADEADADIVIEVAVPSQTTVELASTEAGSIMAKDDVIGIYGSNQDTTEGILAADANLSVLGNDPSADVIGVGFDAGSTIKAAISSGQLYGAITQSPLAMGYYTVYALVKAANGEEVEDMYTDGYWYDSSNMDDDSIAPNLYD